MPRRVRIALVSAGIVGFLLVSFVLARFLAVENVERDAVLGLLRAQARGDAATMLASLRGCRAACADTARADAAALRGPGPVTILAYQSPTAYSLGGATGRTRIAWRLPGRLPDVQCVLVRRSGSAVTGLSVSLLSLSSPIPLQSDC